MFSVSLNLAPFHLHLCDLFLRLLTWLTLPYPLNLTPHRPPIGMFAIRAERDYVVDEDFMKAVRKVCESKKLESTLDYKKV